METILRQKTRVPYPELGYRMKQRMDELYDISKIEGWDRRKIQTEVIGLQTEVRQGLDSGKYKTH